MLLFLAALLIPLASALSLHEPPNGQLYLAAWLDTADSAPGAADGDRPVKFQNRLGFNLSSFQFAQNLPVLAGDYEFPYEQIQALNDDALVYLTVYPISASNISDEAIANLTTQCNKLALDMRRVILRFAPEMNGYWMKYGLQPTNFVILWKRIYTAFKKDAPNTAIVWAPNAGNSWPWGVTKDQLLPEDFLLLDTNKNGILDGADDPYAAFFPGNEYVDWVGTSNYWFGLNPPYVENDLPIAGKFQSNVDNNGLYQTYSVANKKPFMIAEFGAPLHVDAITGPGELAIKQMWWRQSLTNTTFLDLYPNIKLFCFFEFQKIETDMRDFRLTASPIVLAAFKADFEAVKGRFIMANATVAAVVTVGGGGGAPVTVSATAGFSATSTPRSGGVEKSQVFSGAMAYVVFLMGWAL